MDYLIAGDLLNQIIATGYSARQLGIPFYGLYGACSTMLHHFQDTGFSPEDYDLKGIFTDCGVEIFYQKEQDTHAVTIDNNKDG